MRESPEELDLNLCITEKSGVGPYLRVFHVEVGGRAFNITFHFGPHSVGRDLEPFYESLAVADVVVPEMIYWDQNTLIAMQRVADGDSDALKLFTPNMRYTGDFRTYIARYLEGILGSGAIIAPIDLPSEAESTHAPLFKEIIQKEWLAFKGYEDFASAIVSYREYLDLLNHAEHIREGCMCKRLTSILKAFCESIVRSDGLPIEVLVTLGTEHMNVAALFSKLGGHPLPPYASSDVVAKVKSRAGERVDDLTIARALLEKPVREHLNHFLEREGETGKLFLDQVSAFIVSHFTFDEIGIMRGAPRKRGYDPDKHWYPWFVERGVALPYTINEAMDLYSRSLSVPTSPIVQHGSPCLTLS